MPSFEKLFDEFALDLTKDDPVAHAYRRGRSAGKKRALEIVAIALLVAVVVGTPFLV